MEINPEIIAKIQQLEEKYAAMGQDMLSYLDGLLYSNSLTYWDYIHLDTLLSLQNPRTDFPDEKIFIIYHQITELYFKLIRSEIEQLTEVAEPTLQIWMQRITRLVNYFKNLCHSFDVMVEGMDPNQFLKFRMSLLPASGFQSVQFRFIEIMSTGLYNLMSSEKREALGMDAPLKAMFDAIYWKEGNLELKTGRKTLTLRMFEEKYDKEMLGMAEGYLAKNLQFQWKSLPEEMRQDEKLVSLMREYDLYANVFWRLSHYKSAVRYLQRDPDVIAATGGTNWQKFLPPRFQRIIYFPEIWSAEEVAEWGKAWVLSLFNEKVETQWGKQR